MRVLTVRQPWAWAIIHGGKDVENRSRNIAGDYRGPVAIHAGLRFDNDAVPDVADLTGRNGRPPRPSRGAGHCRRDEAHQRCLRHPPHRPERWGGVMAFEAAYPGPCAHECMAGIKPGEQVESAPHVRHFHRDGNTLYPAYQHVVCPPEPAPAPVCPTCFIVLPVTGTCQECDS